MSLHEMIILADADNTLWDTNAVFRDAQLQLLVRIEAEVGSLCPSEDRLGFVRVYDQALAQRHHLHLRYPPQLLVRSIEAGMAGVPIEQAAKDVIAGRRSSGSV